MPMSGRMIDGRVLAPVSPGPAASLTDLNRGDFGSADEWSVVLQLA